MPGDAPINVGIVGAGGIAALSHLPEIDKVEGLAVTRLCGRKESRLKLLCERHGVPRYGFDEDELIADPEVHAVLVATPHPLHAAAALKALRAGKHVFLQKPLCASLEEADALVEAARARPDLCVYCRPSLDADARTLRQAIAEGRIGKPSGAYCRYSHGGPEIYYAEVADAFNEPRQEDDLWFYDPSQASVGALFDMGIYAVAKLVAVFGRAKSVSARLSALHKPTALEDTAVLALEFADGLLATAETSWNDPARTAVLNAHGTQGKLLYDGSKADRAAEWVQPGSYEREWAAPTRDLLPLAEAPNQHRVWRDAIRSGRQPEFSNIDTARHLMRLLFAALESNASGNRVEIPAD